MGRGKPVRNCSRYYIWPLLQHWDSKLPAYVFVCVCVCVCVCMFVCMCVFVYGSSHCMNEILTLLTLN